MDLTQTDGIEKDPVTKINSDIAVLGRYNNPNLGGKLTVLAAYSTVSELASDARMLRIKDHDDDPRLTYNKLCKFTAEAVDDPEPPRSLNDQFDGFLLCSDWTFKKQWFIPGDIRFFDWVEDGKNIIGFASSFGTPTGDYSEKD